MRVRYSEVYEIAVAADDGDGAAADTIADLGSVVHIRFEPLAVHTWALALHILGWLVAAVVDNC